MTELCLMFFDGGLYLILSNYLFFSIDEMLVRQIIILLPMNKFGTEGMPPDDVA